MKVTGKSKKTRQITAERNVFAQLLLLSMKNKLSMEKVLSYPLIPVPASMATFDGVPAKTDKSALMHAIEKDFTAEKPKETNYIIDGNALLQSLTTLPQTFGLLARSVFSLLPREKRVDFVTDSYLEHSIKSIERHRRGTSKAHLIKGPNTKVPRDWKAFMSNDRNKEQLIEFLFKEWTTDSYAGKLQGRDIFFVHGESCTRLHSRDGTETVAECEKDLCSDQEEADTRIILHLLHIAKETQEDVPIVVRSPDTDVFVLLVHFSHRIKQKVLFDTGVGNKRRLIEVQKVSASLGEDMCAALPALHAFSGSDSTSAFVGKGKQIPLKTLKEHSDFFEVFNALGRSPEIPSYIFDSLEHFVCLLYQKRTPTTNINTLRYLKFAQRFKAKSGKPLSSYNGTDMSVLPPCRDSLRQHVKRSNYQALIWYRADQAMQRIPHPDGHGWEIEDGRLTIKWTDGDLMPQELTDILVEQPDQEDQDDSEDDEMENMYDVIFEEDEEDDEEEEREDQDEEEEG